MVENPIVAQVDGSETTDVPPKEMPRWFGSAFFKAAKEEIWKAFIPGAIAAVGGYLTAILITPQQLYHWAYLRGADTYYGTWYGQIDGQYAELRIDKEWLQSNGRSVSMSGMLAWRGNNMKVEGGADGAVTLKGSLGDHELSISLDRDQGTPGTQQEKMVQLVVEKEGQGASLCPKVHDLRAPRVECTTYSGRTYFHF